MKTRSIFNWFNKLSYLIYFMILGYFAKDCGLGFYFVTFLIYGSLYFIFMDTLMSTVAKMVSVRNYKGLYENSREILYNGLIYALLIGFVTFAVFLISGEYILKHLIGSSIPTIIFKCFAVYFLLRAFSNCIIGYIRGKGYTSIYHIYLLFNGIFLLLLSPFIIRISYLYGEKVANLLKNKLYAYVFSAAGAIVVQIAALCISLLIAIILYKKTIGQKTSENIKNGMRGVENKKSFFVNLFSISLHLLSNHIFSLLSILGICTIYLVSAVRIGVNTCEISSNMGVAIGKYLLICSFPICIYQEYLNSEKIKLHNDFMKEESKNIRIRSQYIIKNCLFLLLPATAVIITLANPIVKIFFDGKMEMAVKMLYYGGVLILLVGATLSLKCILSGIQKNFTIMINSLIASILALLFSLLLNRYHIDVFNIVYSLLIYYFLNTFLLILAYIKVVPINMQDMIGRIIKIVISTVMLIICELILDKLLVMNVFLLFLCILIGYVIYISINILMRGLNKKDIQSLKDSFIYIPLSFICKKFHIR